ncbi:AAA family ATPase [Parvimonas sp. G1604]|uniref:AAA family ATPase n=1 Tax=Parvimonas sp. G1604 TaxID=3388845 RepID=UPI003980A0DC
MKISGLKISGYKNLKNLEMDFEKDVSLIALIGDNGSGKSNVLEALTIIFSGLSMKEKIGFDFEVEYYIGQTKYLICNNAEVLSIFKNGKKIRKLDPLNDLPPAIFLYYCGDTRRLEEIADSNIDLEFNKALKIQEKVKVKYLSLLQLRDFPGALLANALFGTQTFSKVSELLGITRIADKVIFSLKRPNWSKKASINEDSFWNARGTVANLLHQIKDMGNLTISDRDSAVIQIDDWKKLKTMAENIFDILKIFKLLMQADILHSIRFDVLKNDNEISIHELSEGEKQLASLLSFLEATKEYKSLFLLDEFDAFLHPSWQRKFVELVSDIEIRGQIIFTTHSPLSLTKLNKHQIRIFKNGEVEEVTVDTFNRDSAEVMEEIMGVDLRSEEVQKLIDGFKKAALFSDKEKALYYKEQLRKKLSEEDPLWITVEILLSKLGEK